MSLHTEYCQTCGVPFETSSLEEESSDCSKCGALGVTTPQERLDTVIDAIHNYQMLLAMNPIGNVATPYEASLLHEQRAVLTWILGMLDGSIAIAPK